MVRGRMVVELAIALVVMIALAACDRGKARFQDAGPIDASHDGGEVIEPDAGVDAAVGHAGGGTVSGAVNASSPSYRLYGTLRSGDGSSASPGYVRRGGVAGATQP